VEGFSFTADESFQNSLTFEVWKKRNGSSSLSHRIIQMTVEPCNTSGGPQRPPEAFPAC
jgi:hypothetical protein